MRALLIATHNQGKVREIRELLAGSGWQVQALDRAAPEYEETGTTFADNARGKATFYARHSGLLALADDSGLQIEALDGEPGVYSARYIDPAIEQSERNHAVIEKLAEVPDPRRTARFVCHLVLATPDRIVHEARGECGGVITRAPRGEGGFGCDSIFERPELGRTFAELTREEKSALSHRGKAVREMAGFLRNWEPPPGDL